MKKRRPCQIPPKKGRSRPLTMKKFLSKVPSAMAETEKICTSVADRLRSEGNRDVRVVDITEEPRWWGYEIRWTTPDGKDRHHFFTFGPESPEGRGHAHDLQIQ